MARSEITEKCWPTETREELLAKIEAEHGPEVARIVAKDWERNVQGEHKRRGAPSPQHGWYADKGNNAQKGIAVRGRVR